MEGFLYQNISKTVSFQGKTIVLEHLTPDYLPGERQRAQENMKRGLYEIFEKYADNEEKEAPPRD